MVLSIVLHRVLLRVASDLSRYYLVLFKIVMGSCSFCLLLSLMLDSLLVLT